MYRSLIQKARADGEGRGDSLRHNQRPRRSPYKTPRSPGRTDNNPAAAARTAARSRKGGRLPLPAPSNTAITNGDKNRNLFSAKRPNTPPRQAGMMRGGGCSRKAEKPSRSAAASPATQAHGSPETTTGSVRGADHGPRPPGAKDSTMCVRRDFPVHFDHEYVPLRSIC